MLENRVALELTTGAQSTVPEKSAADTGTDAPAQAMDVNPIDETRTDEAPSGATPPGTPDAGSWPVPSRASSPVPPSSPGPAPGRVTRPRPHA